MQKAQKAKLIFYVLLTVCLLLLLVGCQQTQDGKSAYQIALDNGFVGTEAEWLESLKGEDSPKITLEEMYQSAKDNGYEGEFLDFLKEYLMTETSTDFVYSSNKALRSVLSVQAKHVGTTISYIPFYGYVEEEVEFAAYGSGVIFRLDETDGSAYVITNYHVVYSSSSNATDGISKDIMVAVYGQNTSDGLKATYVGGSMNYDIAVLSVGANDLLLASGCVAVETTDSNLISVGQAVMAVGNAEARGISVTKGIVSVPSEYIEMLASDGVTTVEMRVIRMDAGINGGNSGGGLFDEYGRLIGIVNAKMVDEEIEAMGYAIPSNIVVAVVNKIMTQGNVTIASLGVTYEATEETARFDQATQTYILSEKVVVTTNSLLGVFSSGLKTGDVIAGIKLATADKYTEVTREYILSDFLLSCQEGDEITILVNRNGETLELTAVLNSAHFEKVI